MSRRRLGLGVLLASVAIVLAAAAATAAGSRADQLPQVNSESVVQQPLPEDAAPAARPPSTGAERFTLSGESGYQIEPATGGTTDATNQATPQDVTCPGDEPCGP